MKPHTRTSTNTRTSSPTALGLLAALVCLLALTAQAATNTWSGLATPDTDWSTLNNWSPAAVPTAGDTVVFGNAGSTTVRGAVDNTVSSSMTVSNLFFNQISNSASVNFHTTSINDGATLTVDSTLSDTNAYILFVGADVPGAYDQVYQTFTGAGTLAVGNLVSPDTNNDLMVSVRAITTNTGPHKATLDMAGLNLFTFGGGRFQLNANGISGIAGQDRPSGSVLLAKTNIITCARPRADQYPYAISPFAVSVDRYCNPSTNAALLELGQDNTINAEAITIAGGRAGATMKFRTGLTNPTLKLRGADGVSRMAEFGIGDNDLPVGATSASSGVVDLTGGVMDILVDTMDVGRNNSVLSTNSTYNTAAPGVGQFTTGTGGTLDVTTLNIGCQGANNGNKPTGTFTVRAGATVRAGTINIGRDAGGGTLGGVPTGMGVGTLSIIGGTVQVSGDVIENNAPDGNGSSTINIQYGTSMLDMMPPGATVPGNITVDTLKITSGSVVNYGTLSLTNLIFASPTTGFSLNTGQALAPARRGVVGTLTVGGYLTLNSATLAFDLNTPGTSDFIRVTNTLTLNSLNSVEVSAATGGVATGTYTLISAASIVGDASNLQVTGDLVDSRYTSVFDTTSLANSVRLIVSGSPSSLTWSGDGAANLWNLKTDANWNSQTEQFFEFDSVTFNDSSTNLTINLDGTLQAGSVTMASAKNYTLAGSGKLSSVLTQTGAGTLTLAAGSTFVGPVNVNAGTLSANGTVGYAPVTVASGGTLAGSGAVLGPVTVQSGGTLSPSGALALSNNLVLAGGSTTVFKANLTTASQDQVTGLAAVTYGGTLNLVLSGRAVTTNDTFKLFSLGAPLYPQFSPYTGVFTSIVPTTPGLGLGWSTNTLTSDGTLRVIQVVNKTPTNMTAQVSGNQLTLSWPADRIGWRLQGQTNAPSVGLWTNWVDVPNTATNNSYTVTINPTNGSAFYRMVYP